MHTLMTLVLIGLLITSFSAYPLFLRILRNTTQEYTDLRDRIENWPRDELREPTKLLDYKYTQTQWTVQIVVIGVAIAIMLLYLAAQLWLLHAIID